MPRSSCIRTSFVISVCVLLSLTASAKAIALVQGERFLSLPDPVCSFLETRYVLAVAVVLEAGVAVFMGRNRRHLIAMVACSWLSAVFVGYRMLDAAFLNTMPCPCLGRVLDFTGLSPKVVDAIPLALLWYMGAGSLLFLISAACGTTGEDGSGGFCVQRLDHRSSHFPRPSHQQCKSVHS